MTRELCKRCPNVVTIGFSVPDKLWAQVSQGRWNVLCLQCFTTLADEMGLPWDRDIVFWPVSRAAVQAEAARDV
jgi:hypothetical protein